jgi:hypothetical protein
MTYKITDTEGRSGGAWSQTYETREEAAVALRDAFGWEGVVLSHGYSDVDGNGVETTAWSAYDSSEDCDSDNDGAYAPRIVEVF